MTETEVKTQKTALIMVLINALATPMMLSAANVALPSIARELGIHAVMLSWIPMAYLMASAMFVLIFGRLADMFGRKRIFVMGTTSVVLTSFLAAYSVNGEMLIVARFLQGVSAAMLYATQIAIVSSVFPPAKRGHAIGMTVAMIYLGLTCGPIIGGYLIDNFGWRSSFIFHVPLSFIVLYYALFKVEGDWHSESRGKFDINGSIIYSMSILLLCVGVSTLPDNLSYIAILCGIVGMVIFFNLSHRIENPIFDVRLFFTNRVFTLSCLASLIMYTATYANVVLIGLYLQYLKDISATNAGLFMMIQPLTMAIFSSFIGKLSDRVEPRIIASSGMSVTIVGLIMLAFMDGQSNYHYLIAALIITGLGFSLFSSPNANAIMSAVEKRFYGTAAGSIATMRVLGQMSSMILVTLMFALVIGQVEIKPENYPALQTAIHYCFTISALLCLPGILLSLARGSIHNDNHAG